MKMKSFLIPALALALAGCANYNRQNEMRAV